MMLIASNWRLVYHRLMKIRRKVRVVVKGLEKTKEAALLRRAGFKTTPGRIAVLKVLEKAKKPFSVSRIREAIDELIDETTLYRALEALSVAHVLKRIDFEHGHAHYEIALGREHHHHLVCRECGEVEDVANCNVQALEKSALRKSKMFSRIAEHSLEFFGICNDCVKK